MREICLDTETTGFDPASGHRIVEIACIELMDGSPTSRPPLHLYINPERDMPEDAFKVHGLSSEFLAQHPPFAKIVDQFLEFIGTDSRLVIHNAEFDMRFLNAELKRCKKPTIDPDRAFCTLIYARRKFPGSPASLDALCRRFEIDNSHRVKHGALLDTELLAEVYVELLGGKQRGLNLSALEAEEANTRPLSPLSAPDRPARPPRPHAASPEELARHAAFVAKLKNPIWLTLAEAPEAAATPTAQ